MWRQCGRFGVCFVISVTSSILTAIPLLLQRCYQHWIISIAIQKITWSFTVTQSDYTHMFAEDLLDIVKLCHAGLAQDSPETPRHYLNQILNMGFGYLTITQRKAIETYLAEKEYLPPLKLVAPNETEANQAANIIINE